MNTLAFFNSTSGVGQTALVSHLAWMLAERGVPVLAVDLDPQSNLSSIILTEDRLADLWEAKQTIGAALTPLSTGSDLVAAHLEPIAEHLHLLAGEQGVSRFEDLLAENWGKCLSGEVAAFRVMSAFHRVMKEAAERIGVAWWGAP